MFGVFLPFHFFPHSFYFPLHFIDPNHNSNILDIHTRTVRTVHHNTRLVFRASFQHRRSPHKTVCSACAPAARSRSGAQPASACFRCSHSKFSVLFSALPATADA